MSNELLRALVDLRDRQIQKARIQFSNRLAALENATDDAGDSQQHIVVMRWLDVFQTLEEQLDRDITAHVKRYPIFEEMSGIRGIGPILSAKILAMIDIERANNISALWRYAGYAVYDGQRERKVKGRTLHYNIRLKSTLYVLAGSFLKCNSPYRQIYDSAKAHYQAARPEWSKLQIHYAAIRKMMKIFLSHLWLRWRVLENLPTTEPYVFVHLSGHSDYLPPEDFGWAIEVESNGDGTEAGDWSIGVDQ
jgi:transposase